jgi:hypothetical protein
MWRRGVIDRDMKISNYGVDLTDPLHRVYSLDPEEFESHTQALMSSEEQGIVSKYDSQVSSDLIRRSD